VLETGMSLTTKAGDFEEVLLTKEWTPLEPDVVEQKYYAPGVGLVREEVVSGGEGTIDLIAYDVAE